MAFSFNKFHCFVEDLAEKAHNLGSDTLKCFLSNAAPNASTHTAYDATTGTTGPAEIANGNGYTAGGVTVSQSASAQTSGTYKLTMRSDKALARAFQDWIAKDVLPAIRKTAGLSRGYQKRRFSGVS